MTDEQRLRTMHFREAVMKGRIFMRQGDNEQAAYHFESASLLMQQKIESMQRDKARLDALRATLVSDLRDVGGL